MVMDISHGVSFAKVCCLLELLVSYCGSFFAPPSISRHLCQVLASFISQTHSVAIFYPIAYTLNYLLTNVSHSWWGHSILFITESWNTPFSGFRQSVCPIHICWIRELDYFFLLYWNHCLWNWCTVIDSLTPNKQTKRNLVISRSSLVSRN